MTSEPATTTPVRDYADIPCPGASEDYLVVPRSLAQSMPLRWQQLFVGLLADLHDAYDHLGWPEYGVIPGRRLPLTDLDEQQLAAAGYVTDLDADGGLVYLDVAGGAAEQVDSPETLLVLAPVADPVPPAAAGHVDPQAVADRIG